MGLLFESLAVRDLRIYAQSLGARLYYYGDESGLEADAIIDGIDGQWAAVEIKLGGGTAITKAMDSLRAVRARVDPTRRGPPGPPNRPNRLRPRLPNQRRHRRRTPDSIEAMSSPTPVAEQTAGRLFDDLRVRVAAAGRAGGGVALEDHLRRPVEVLVESVAEDLGYSRLVLAGEIAGAVGGARPDYTVARGGLVVGHMELKAPGAGGRSRGVPGSQPGAVAAAAAPSEPALHRRDRLDPVAGRPAGRPCHGSGSTGQGHRRRPDRCGRTGARARRVLRQRSRCPGYRPGACPDDGPALPGAAQPDSSHAGRRRIGRARCGRRGLAVTAVPRGQRRGVRRRVRADHHVRADRRTRRRSRTRR